LIVLIPGPSGHAVIMRFPSGCKQRFRMPDRICKIVRAGRFRYVRRSLGTIPLEFLRCCFLIEEDGSGSPGHKKRSWLVTRYRLEAYATLLSGLAREVWKSSCRYISHPRRNRDGVK
jgi:hypothetical protein